MPKRNRRREEQINVATHGIGTLLAVAACWSMLYVAAVRGGITHVVAALLFGGGLVALYAASTAYHAMTQLRHKKLFQTIDHLCIYLLIAGTYTPVALLGLKGNWGIAIFGAIWLLTAIGFLYKLTPLRRYHKLSLALYLGMGWLIVVAIFPLLRSVPREALWLLGAGGLCYTSGTYFFARENMPYYHCIWHVLVMAGSTFHFLGIFWYLMP